MRERVELAEGQNISSRNASQLEAQSKRKECDARAARTISIKERSPFSEKFVCAFLV